MKQHNIYFFHLLNDYSGSPKVLAQVIKCWKETDYTLHVCTSLKREGFLSGIKHVQYIDNSYSFKEHKIFRLILFMWSQLFIFFRFLISVKKGDIIYINTVLPFGAAFVGKIKGARVIYHIHETSITPILLKNILFGIAKWSAWKAVFVSDFVRKQETGFASEIVIHNAISDSFLRKAFAYDQELKEVKNILMICSLKKYKGVHEFLALAKSSPSYEFRLVVNASEKSIQQFFMHDTIPPNLRVFPTQQDVHPFYQWAHVVLNLSRVDEWLETFGLTIIEAMAYGLPVIIPPSGGITELIEEGKEGYKVDSLNVEMIRKKMEALMQNKDLYVKMSAASRKRVLYFSENEFHRKNLALLES